MDKNVPQLIPTGLRRLAAALLIALPAVPAFAQSDEASRIREASTVFGEIMSAPDSAIPKSVLDRAEAVAVFPSVVKAGFIFGGQRGRGIISVRDRKSGSWSAPAFLTLTGGSFGAQIGGSAVDLVLVITDARGTEQLLGNEFKIGGEATAAAGPVGRNAEAATDIQMRAQILSYSRSRGLFAGISVAGSAVKQDKDANQRFYGKSLTSKQVTLEHLTGSPEPVGAWRSTLAKYF